MSSLGDGIVAAGGPLLAASLTDDPLLISASFVATTLPYLLFSLPAGLLLDRVDLRRTLVAVDAVRFGVLTGLTIALALGHANLGVLYVCMFILGLGEVLMRNAIQVFVPQIVDRRALAAANSSLLPTQQISRGVFGSLVGAALFAAGMIAPFGAGVAAYLCAALLFAKIVVDHRSHRLALENINGTAAAANDTHQRITPTPTTATESATTTPVASHLSTKQALAHHRKHTGPSPTTAEPQQPATPQKSVQGAWAEMTAGLMWLLRNNVFRTLALIAAVINLVTTAGASVLIVLASDRFALGSIGFGLLLACQAVGAIAAGAVAPAVQRQYGRETTLVVAVAAVAVSAALKTLSPYAWLLGVALALFSAALVLWNVVLTEMRQTLTPAHLIGRVNAAYLWVAAAPMPIGAAMGGVLTTHYGIASVYAIEAVAATIITAGLGWGAHRRWMRHILATEPGI